MITFHNASTSPIRDGTSNIKDGTSNTIAFGELHSEHSDPAFAPASPLGAFLQYGGDTFVWPSGTHDFIL